MDPSQILAIPLFASLPSDEAGNLARLLQVVELGPTELLFQEGDAGNSFYIVLDGEMEIVKALGTVDERLLAVRGPGSYVGEMSLLEHDGLRMASVRARSRLRALQMTRQEFDQLLHRQPGVALAMVRELSRRLSDAHDVAIRDLHEKNRQLTIAYEELKAAQQQIVEKERLEKELAVARQIQESILPRTLPELTGVDIGALIRPTRAVGGDLFDVIDLGDGHLGVAVADVSDKGVPAAIFMALTRSLLRAEASRSPSPFDVLQNVNRVLLEMNEAGMFVTVLYGVLDAAARVFHFVRAGHELPLAIAPDGTLQAVPKGKGQPLGLFQDPLLDEQMLPLPQNSLVLVYTDGVTDQDDEGDNSFGLDRLRDALRQTAALPAKAACTALLAAVDTFRGGAPQTDDITFVAARIR